MRPRSRTRCESPCCLRRWLMVSPAWPPPMTSVSTRSIGMMSHLARGFAARGGGRGGAHDPAPERDEVALLGLKAAIDQVPAHALGHAQRKRRDQPSRGEVVVDIGPDAHGDAEPVDGRLQGLAIELKFRSARRNPRNASGLQPGPPILAGLP